MCVGGGKRDRGAEKGGEKRDRGAEERQGAKGETPEKTTYAPFTVGAERGAGGGRDNQQRQPNRGSLTRALAPARNFNR